MTEHRARVLRIERTFDAPVERVFEAWTSEEVLRRWLHGMPGWETPTAEVDLRVGGRIRIVMRDPSDGTEAGATGEYTGGGAAAQARLHLGLGRPARPAAADRARVLRAGRRGRRC